MEDIVNVLKKKDRLCGFCKLLDIPIIREELNDYIGDFELKSFKRIRLSSIFLFEKNDERVYLNLEREKIILSKYSDYFYERTRIDGNLILSKKSLEKREKGILFTDVVKKYCVSKRFKEKTVLSDLFEIRYAIVNENVCNLMKTDNIDEVRLPNLFLKLYYLSNEKLSLLSSLTNNFDTHMGIIYNNPWKFIRNDKNSFFPTNTYFNGQDVSRVYDMINDDEYKLYRVYDLYRGVVNNRNLIDVKSIFDAWLSSSCFLLESEGISKKEEDIIGKTINEDVLNSKKYLISALIRDLNSIQSKLLDCDENLVSSVLVDKANGNVTNFFGKLLKFRKRF